MQVRKLQDYITDHFYTCSDKILCGLGRDVYKRQVIDTRNCHNPTSLLLKLKIISIILNDLDSFIVSCQNYFLIIDG